MIRSLILPLVLLVQGQPRSPKATVEGVVLRAGTNQPLAGVQVRLTPLVKFANLLPGDYSLAIRDIPVDSYVKEARFGSRDGLSGPISIAGPGSDSIDIVISTNGAQVSGTAVGADSKPIPNIQAVLIPAGANPRPDLYKAAYTDTAGRFTIRGIAPGDYTLLPWEQTTRSYMDRDFVRELAALGTLVHVSEGSKQVIETKAIHPTTKEYR